MDDEQIDALVEEAEAGFDVSALMPRGQSAERLARRFHEVYERLAPRFGYETRTATAVPWELVPADNKALMIAVCTQLLAPQRRSVDGAYRHVLMVDTNDPDTDPVDLANAVLDALHDAGDHDVVAVTPFERAGAVSRVQVLEFDLNADVTAVRVPPSSSVLDVIVPDGVHPLLLVEVSLNEPSTATATLTVTGNPTAVAFETGPCDLYLCSRMVGDQLLHFYTTDCA